jgi:ribosome maturation factor RimP
MGAEEEIRQAVLPAVLARGLEIWDVERSGATVRVLVERPGGVDLDALSELSNAISALLDRRDDLVPAGRYVLEVSSPGLERRLRDPSHFARSVGEEVALKTAEPFAGSCRLTGTLVEASETEIALRLAPDAGEGQVRGAGEVALAGEVARIPLASVLRAHRVFRWPEAQVPAHDRHRRPARPKASAQGGRPKLPASADLAPRAASRAGARSRRRREALEPGHGALSASARTAEEGAPWLA